jgi:hypothetical protein
VSKLIDLKQIRPNKNNIYDLTPIRHLIQKISMITPFEAVEIKAVLAGVMDTEEGQARLRSNPSFAKRFRMEDFKKLMSKNKLEDAIQLFDSDGFIDNDEKNMIIHFKRQLHSLKKEAQLGKLSHSEFAREESKIADACLGWVNDLESA